MKIKRAISAALILLTLLCSSEVFSQTEPLIKNTADIETQYVEFSQDVSQEFREGLKIGFSEEDRSTVHVMCTNAAEDHVNTIAYRRYKGYLKEYLSRKATAKLFIDFGAIII